MSHTINPKKKIEFRSYDDELGVRNSGALWISIHWWWSRLKLFSLVDLKARREREEENRFFAVIAAAAAPPPPPRSFWLHHGRFFQVPSHSKLAKWVTVASQVFNKRQEKWTRWVHTVCWKGLMYNIHLKKNI